MARVRARSPRVRRRRPRARGPGTRRRPRGTRTSTADPRQVPADDVVLVGHSAAGRLIPLVADRLDRGAACVFVDAQLPVDLLAAGCRRVVPRPRALDRGRRRAPAVVRVVGRRRVGGTRPRSGPTGRARAGAPAPDRRRGGGGAPAARDRCLRPGRRTCGPARSSTPRPTPPRRSAGRSSASTVSTSTSRSTRPGSPTPRLARGSARLLVDQLDLIGESAEPVAANGVEPSPRRPCTRCAGRGRASRPGAARPGAAGRRARDAARPRRRRTRARSRAPDRRRATRSRSSSRAIARCAVRAQARRREQGGGERRPVVVGPHVEPGAPRGPPPPRRCAGRSQTPSRHSASRARRSATRTSARTAAGRGPPVTATAMRQVPSHAARRGRRLDCCSACRRASAPASSYVVGVVAELAGRRSCGAARPGPCRARCRTARTSAPGPGRSPGAAAGRAAGSPSPTGPRAGGPRRTVLRDCIICCNHRNVSAVPADPDPDERAPGRARRRRPDRARPASPARSCASELRRIPNVHNVVNVVALYAITIGIFVAHRAARQRVRLDRRVPRDGPDPRAVRHPHARVGAPAAVLEPPRQRLRRQVVHRLPGVRPDRPLPPRPHGAPPRGVRPQRARHPAVPRVPDPARLDGPQAPPRRVRHHRLEAHQGPVPRRRGRAGEGPPRGARASSRPRS